jgi:hypothetical protein
MTVQHIHLWPSVIQTSVLPLAVSFNSVVLQDLITTGGNNFKFDQNSIAWEKGLALPALKKLLLESAQEWLDSTQVKDVEIELTNSWVHTSLPLQGIPYHNHHNSELVGIYVLSTGVEGGVIHTDALYHDAQSTINTPMGAPKGPNSIVLLDPRAGKVTLEENGFKSFYEVPLETGTLVLFPSYLSYYVMPNVGADPRVLIMCNFEVE